MQHPLSERIENKLTLHQKGTNKSNLTNKIQSPKQGNIFQLCFVTVIRFESLLFSHKYNSPRSNELKYRKLYVIPFE